MNNWLQAGDLYKRGDVQEVGWGGGEKDENGKKTNYSERKRFASFFYKCSKFF
jgi:hypothetical protein